MKLRRILKNHHHHHPTHGLYYSILWKQCQRWVKKRKRKNKGKHQNPAIPRNALVLLFKALIFVQFILPSIQNFTTFRHSSLLSMLGSRNEMCRLGCWAQSCVSDMGVWLAWKDHDVSVIPYIIREDLFFFFFFLFLQSAASVSVSEYIVENGCGKDIGCHFYFPPF